MTTDMPDPKSVSVEIFGQRYPIRSALDAEYVSRLASFVDGKIRAAGESAPNGDPVRLAVLAALNIADELCTARQRHDQIANLAGSLQNSQHSTRNRASTLAQMLDEVLEDRKVG